MSQRDDVTKEPSQGSVPTPIVGFGPTTVTSSPASSFRFPHRQDSHSPKRGISFGVNRVQGQRSSLPGTNLPTPSGRRVSTTLHAIRRTSGQSDIPDTRQYKKGELLSTSMTSYLIKTVRSSRQRGELVVHTFLVGVLCVMLALSKVENNASRPYFVYSAVKDLSLGTIPPPGIEISTAANWENIDTVAYFWDWIDGFVDRLWLTPSGEAQNLMREHNKPLSYIVFYQQRLQRVNCTPDSHSVLLSPNAANDIYTSNECRPAFGGQISSLSREAFGPNGEYLSNYEKKLGGVMPIVKMSTNIQAEVFRYFSDHDRIFTERLNLHTNKSVIKQHLNQLRNNKWIDSETRIVGFDFYTFNDDEKFFTQCQIFAEVTAGGEFRPQSFFTPFSMTASSLEHGRDYAILSLDIIILLVVMIELYNLIVTVRSNAELEADWTRSISIWEVINIVNVALFVVNYYYRFLLLDTSLRSNDYVVKTLKSGEDLETHMFGLLSNFAHNYNNNIIFQAWNVLLSWLRLFQYLQYNERLNVVSETVKQAAGELMAMFVISVIILMAYAFMGHLLFGPTVGTFRDFGRSFGTLLRFVYGEAWDDYRFMVHAYPSLSALFVITFLIIIWLILLNLVLAIITGSFAIVQESLEDPDWSLDSLVGDIRDSIKKVKSMLFKKRKKNKKKYKEVQRIPKRNNEDELAVDDIGDIVESEEELRNVTDEIRSGVSDSHHDPPPVVVADDDQQSDDSDQEDPTGITNTQSVQIIRLLRFAKKEKAALYITQEDLLDLAPFLTDEQAAELLRRARMQFNGKQQMIKMGERLGQHMHLRLLEIEAMVMRLLGLEPAILNGIPNLEEQVQAGFEHMDNELAPNITEIKTEITKLQQIQTHIGAVKSGMQSVEESSISLQGSLNRLQQDLQQNLVNQADTLIQVVSQLNMLQSVPDKQQELLRALQQADDMHRKTTEQLLVPLKAGLVELQRTTKVKAGLSIASAMAERQQHTAEVQQEATDFKQYYGDMVTEVFSPGVDSSSGGPQRDSRPSFTAFDTSGVASEGEPLLSDASVTRTRRKSKAVAEVLAELGTSSTTRPKPPDIYDPAKRASTSSQSPPPGPDSE